MDTQRISKENKLRASKNISYLIAIFRGAGVFLNIFFIVCAGVGISLIRDGITEGKRLGRTDTSKTYSLIVKVISKRNEKIIFPKHIAQGQIAETLELQSVDIYRYEYLALKPGNVIPVYLTMVSEPKYVNKSKFENTEPFYRLANIYLSWKALVGLAELLIGVALFVYFIPKKK